MSSTSFKRLAIVLGSGVFRANKFNLDLSGSIIRSTKLQVNINLVVKLNDSITFLSAAWAFIVKKSDSSNITT